MIEENGVVLREPTYKGFKTFFENPENFNFMLMDTALIETDVFIEKEQKMQSFTAHYFYIVGNIYNTTFKIDEQKVLVEVDFYTNESLNLKELKENILNEMKTNYDYMIKDL